VAELNKDKVNVIAFYLPQFHAIPENDESYGTGFTEWTNVKKAKALFEGHKQPRVPLNDNYYNLLNDGVMRQQAELAKKYGIFGFCYYHYWFANGKKLLEKPIENMLADKSIEMPFCLCWANENWTRKWDGGNNEIVAKQDYDDKSQWYKHLEYLIGFFKDDRYIKIDGKPLFVFYKPWLMPNYKEWTEYMRKEIKAFGFEDIIFAVQDPQYYLHGMSKDIYDYYIAFEPNYTDSEKAWNSACVAKKLLIKFTNLFPFRARLLNIYSVIKKLLCGQSEYCLKINDYDEELNIITNRNSDDKKFVYGMFTDWDNTPRNRNGRVFRGATPQKFGNACEILLRKIKDEGKLNCLFINAWNEWAEGAYLEPDTLNGYGYLEALNSAIKNIEG